MSFKNPKAQKPFSKTLQWRGSEGKFVYYDGEENVDFAVEKFIVLEELASISGYSKSDDKGIWSNEVMDLQGETLEVRVGREVRFAGLYSDIKGAVKGLGGKFTNVVYALVDKEIVRFLMAGSACSGWIGKEFDPMARQCGVVFSGSHTDVNGGIEYQVPDFDPVELTGDEIDKAIEACDVIEKWLKSRDNTYKDKDDREQNQELPEPDDYSQDDQEREANSAFQSAYDDEVPF